MTTADSIEVAAEEFAAKWAHAGPDREKLAKAAFLAGASMGVAVAGEMLKELA